MDRQLVVGNLLDPNYQLGYVEGYIDAIEAMLEKCEKILGRTPAVENLRSMVRARLSAMYDIVDRSELMIEYVPAPNAEPDSARKE